MTALPGAATETRCRNHPDRVGVGVCVPCRRVVCAECSTKLDGVNHCRQCLEVKLGRARRKPGTGRQVVEAVVAAGGVSLAFVALVGIFYAIGASASGVAWFSAGDRLAKTATRMLAIEAALKQFKNDVGRFPTPREELRALEEDEPVPLDGPIPGWSGPYLYPGEKGESPALDGYGRRIRYVGGPARARPAIVSLGADGQLDTDLDGLKYGDVGDNDDKVSWVR